MYFYTYHYSLFFGKGLKTMMVDLIVEKLPEFVRAGDIVGAITNEVQIEGSQIGKIQINKKRGKALVQVDAEVAEAVVNVMNTKQISGADVKFDVKDTQRLQRQKVRDYINIFKNHLYQERQEKNVHYRLEMRRLSDDERQRLGHALLALHGYANGFPTDHFYQVRFVLEDDEDLPPHKFRVGDQVIVNRGNPLHETNPRGMVVAIDPKGITVEFKGDPPASVYEGEVRIDLYSSDFFFQQVLKTLKNLYHENTTTTLKEILIGEIEPDWIEGDIEIQIPYKLDDEQRDAFARAIKAKDVFLIQGGAGTGKTTVGVEILKHSLKQGLKVLAVGATAVSRDCLASKLTEEGLKVLKLADVELSNEPEYYAVNHLFKSIYRLLARRDELSDPRGEWANGLSYKEILEKSKCSRGYKDIPGYRLKEMAEWIELQQRIDDKLEEIKQHEEKIWQRLYAEHDLICVTVDEAVQFKKRFDLVLIDDTHLLTEPEILPAYLLGKKTILLGDLAQIAPNVINMEARKGGLGKSLFVRLVEEIDDDWIGTLSTQHRLDRAIWRCLSGLSSVGEKLQINLVDNSIGVNPFCTGPTAKILEDPASLVFIDTSQMAIQEKRHGNQYTNDLEADLIREILQMGIDLPTMANKMAILTFYQAQVQLVKKQLKSNGINLDSVYMVDEFSGNEKDVTIISLVHSNSIGYLGRSGSIPHLITALTRARKKCIVIGNPETLKAHPVYQQLIDEVQHWGKMYTL